MLKNLKLDRPIVFVDVETTGTNLDCSPKTSPVIGKRSDTRGKRGRVTQAKMRGEMR